MVARIDVNHNIITWAIARAGYDLSEFASDFPNVLGWLSGEKKPTVKQLEKFSRKVHLPFGYLFLPQPPNEKIAFPFFRTGKGASNKVSLNVYDSIQDMQRRQEWLSEFLRNNGNEPLVYVGHFNHTANYIEVVESIRETIKLGPNWALDCQTWEDALNLLTSKIEEAGTIVSFNGIVGNNTHRVIPVDECRGYVLVDEYVPFMYVNSSDAKAAQLFTIVHELAHIWLGKSAGFDNNELIPADDPFEKLCDQIAAEFLVPENVFLANWRGAGDIQRLATKFKVSQLVMARRALDLGKINKAMFFAFYYSFMAGIQKKKENQGPGGDFYATARKRISTTFAAYVDSAVKTGGLPYRDAFKLTGLKGDTYQKFISEHLT